MARDFPDRPVVGVGVVVWRGDDVLLVRRGRPPRKGQWGLPGGVQELGETLFEAAAREVREETGVAIEPRAVLTAVDSITPEEDGRVRFHYTLVEVDADWRSGEAVAADDADDARWAGAADVERLVEWAATREVIALARERRRPVRRRGLAPRLKPRPRMGRLMQSPLGAMLARPWLDEVTIRVLADWALPMSRAWAAAIAADGEHERFLAEIPLAPGAIVRSPWLARSLEDVRRAAAALRRADATWQRALFSAGSDEAAGVAAEEARLDAANALNLLRLRFAVFARARRVQACRWAIPSPEAVEAVHGAALAAPDSAYDLPAVLPEVRVSRGLASALGRDCFLTFASPSGLVASPCWARVFTPEGIADPPTVVHLHGICMEQDHVRTPLREIETWVRAGVRVIAAEAPWHGRRRLPGRYGGEPLVATAPLGLLDHFATHVRELAILTRWARATSRGAVGWSGLSLGALTIQVAAGRAMRWPAACRADAMLLSTTADGIEEMGISGSLGRAFGVGPALEAAGWTPETLRRWRPLVDTPEVPYMGAANVFMVLGSRDTVTPFERGIALARRWKLPESNLHVREQGHFSVPAGLMVDDRPIEAFARALGAG